AFDLDRLLDALRVARNGDLAHALGVFLARLAGCGGGGSGAGRGLVRRRSVGRGLRAGERRQAAKSDKDGASQWLASRDPCAGWTSIHRGLLPFSCVRREARRSSNDTGSIFIVRILTPV